MAALTQAALDRVPAAGPLYSQIARTLEARIASGELRPGTRLPAERELSQALGVNRMTLRQALQALEAKGLLDRRQGDGTYVALPVIERQAGKLVSFTLGMKRRGYQPGARIVRFSQRPAGAPLAAELRLPVAALVYDLVRLRLVNGEPVMLERYAIPVARFPGLDRYDLEARSMYEIMQKEYGVAVSQARQSLEPVVAGQDEAALLQVPAGAPLMLERRVSFDAQRQPIEHGSDLYRGDRFRFVTEMAPLE